MAHFVNECANVAFITRRVTENSYAAFIRHRGTECTGALAFAILEIDEAFLAHACEVRGQPRRKFVEYVLRFFKLSFHRSYADRQGVVRMIPRVPRTERRCTERSGMFGMKLCQHRHRILLYRVPKFLRFFRTVIGTTHRKIAERDKILVTKIAPHLVPQLYHAMEKTRDLIVMIEKPLAVREPCFFANVRIRIVLHRASTGQGDRLALDLYFTRTDDLIILVNEIARFYTQFRVDRRNGLDDRIKLIDKIRPEVFADRLLVAALEHRVEHCGTALFERWCYDFTEIFVGFFPVLVRHILGVGIADTAGFTGKIGGERVPIGIEAEPLAGRFRPLGRVDPAFQLRELLLDKFFR